MSDLQCPARFLVARHGEAMYADPELLSDEGGWLTDLGKEQAADLADRLRGERVAAVYTSRLARARETGAVVGDRLGLTAATVEGVQEFSVGSLAGTPAMGPDAREVFVAWVTRSPRPAVAGRPRRGPRWWPGSSRRSRRSPTGTAARRSSS